MHSLPFPNLSYVKFHFGMVYVQLIPSIVLPNDWIHFKQSKIVKKTSTNAFVSGLNIIII
jgi:hypothetical protein